MLSRLKKRWSCTCCRPSTPEPRRCSGKRHSSRAMRSRHAGSKRGEKLSGALQHVAQRRALAVGEAPSANGLRPTTISYTSTPSAHQSTAAP